MCCKLGRQQATAVIADKSLQGQSLQELHNCSERNKCIL